MANESTAKPRVGLLIGDPCGCTPPQPPESGDLQPTECFQHCCGAVEPLDILAAGNAVDAAIGCALVQTAVDPLCGIAGFEHHLYLPDRGVHDFRLPRALALGHRADRGT